MKAKVSEHGLDGVEIFRDLEESERARLAAELETLNLKRGDVLVRQGEVADALYVVSRGASPSPWPAAASLLAEVGPGQPVGEIAFLAGGVRTATVTALRDSLVLRLGRAEFEELSSKSPSIWRTLTVTLARRVAVANISRTPPPDPRPRTVTLIRAGAQRAAAELHRRPDARVPAQQPHHAGVAGDGAARCCPTSCPSTAPRRRARSTRSKRNTTTCCSSPSRS